MNISTLFFDADGTLWDFEKVLHHALEQALAELRRLLPEPQTAQLTTQDLDAARNQVAHDWRGQGYTHEQIRLRGFELVLKQLGRPDLAMAQHLTNLYLHHRFNDIELFPDVLPALTRLKTRYRLGLISNGNTYPERCGLADTFDVVIFAHEHRVSKPDPTLYSIALQHARISPLAALHVGDSLTHDIEAAQACGILGVWLNRKKIANATMIQPHAEIATLDELATVPGLCL